jgi:hypothetical protein
VWFILIDVDSQVGCRAVTPTGLNPRVAKQNLDSIPELRDRADRAEGRVRSLEQRVDQLERALVASDKAREDIRLWGGPEQIPAVQEAVLVNLIDSTPVALRELARRIEQIVSSS